MKAELDERRRQSLSWWEGGEARALTAHVTRALQFESHSEATGKGSSFPVKGFLSRKLIGIYRKII